MRRELEFVLTASQEESERLQLQFGDVETKTPLGPSLQHSAVFYTCDLDAMPDYRYEDDEGGHSIGGMTVRVGYPNRDYHRQLAQYIQHSVMLRKVGFVVYNGNRKAINDLTMKIVLKKIHGLVVLDDKPVTPSKSATDHMMRDITPISSYFARPGKLTVKELPDRYEIQIEFGKVQPEANAWSEPLFIGTSESCNLEMTAALFGDEITTPKQVNLGLSFQVTQTPMNNLSDEEWVRLLQDADS